MLRHGHNANNKKNKMKLKRISSNVIPIAKQVVHAALGRKQAMPTNAPRLFPHVHSRARQQDCPCPLR